MCLGDGPTVRGQQQSDPEGVSVDERVVGQRADHAGFTELPGVSNGGETLGIGRHPHVTTGGVPT